MDKKFILFRYLKGSFVSELTKNQTLKSDKKLYIIKGDNSAKITEVPFRGSSLNKSDAFILVDRYNIYEWYPAGTNPNEIEICDINAKRIKKDEFNGNANIIKIGIQLGFKNCFKIKI